MKRSSLSVSEMSKTRYGYRRATENIRACTDRCTWRKWLSACWCSRRSQKVWAFLFRQCHLSCEKPRLPKRTDYG